ncbi:hypothetical protein [Alteribacter populi]|uniref:hypothetical protein n=1 Tax=Alteribacter populi TaxID=2011011 RepID=UPI000BBA5D20|nr:hypothetical protein [Alteribacter populi]
MNKSDLLDELRLEVGRAYDYAVSQQDFIGKVGQAIFDGTKRILTIVIYRVDCQKVKPLHFYGNSFVLGGDGHFGDGALNICLANRSVILRQDNKQTLHIPICDDGKIRYIFSLKISAAYYTVTEQDLLFLEELSRFVEVKRKLL